MRVVDPRKKVFEDGAGVIEVFGPSSPVANIPYGPPELHMKILAAATTERVRAVRAWVDADVQHVVPETLEEVLR